MCVIFDRLKRIACYFLSRKSDGRESGVDARQWTSQGLNDTNFDHVYFHCVDKPYSFISFELLLTIRACIESTACPKQKAYLRLLEDFITVLDYLCHERSRRVLVNYVNKLNEFKKNERDAQFRFLVNLVMNALKLGLQSVHARVGSVEMLEQKIARFQSDLICASRTFKASTFVTNYCKIVDKLPVLALIRRGLRTELKD
jgi:hypothetical protein